MTESPLTNREGFLTRVWRDYSILVVLLGLMALSTLVTAGDFLRPENLLNVAVQTSVNGILAVGMTMIILTGGIDLGVGSLLALFGVIIATLQLNLGLGTLSSILLVLSLGLLVGAWNGFFITRFRLPPFIVTLGTMTVARGLALVISGGRAIAPVNNNFATLATLELPRSISLAFLIVLGLFLLYRHWSVVAAERPRPWAWYLTLGGLLAVLFFFFWLLASPAVTGLPMPVILFAVTALAGAFLLRTTRFGRYLFAIGGNPVATRLAGINVERILFFDYVLMGFLSAVAGLLLASRMAAGVPTAGNMAELDAIAAVVIGGTSLQGGAATIGGTVIGAFIIQILNNVLVIMNVEANFQYIVKGLIIMGAVLLDSRKK